MKKLLVIILTLLMSLIGATTLMGCGETEQPDNRSGFEKIVDFIEETGTDNVIYLQGNSPSEDVKIKYIGNLIRLEYGDGNYFLPDGITNNIELDLKENTKEYNYDAYWMQNNGTRFYNITGKINADTFTGESVPIPYSSYSSYAAAPTTLELRILNQQTYKLISTARNHIKNSINIDLYIEFGFDKLLK